MNKLLMPTALLLLSLSAAAQVRLPRLVRDSMVLQRDTKIRLWGWAAAGEKVAVKFNNKTYKTTTGANGNWTVFLPPTKAGGPYTINIDASNHITLKDVLIGDVWICSGQSNMVHQVALHRERYEKEIAASANPNIRHFGIPMLTDLQSPHDDLPAGSWKAADPENVLQFSAVAYFFAKQIYDRYKVPIGLINASIGGTPIEAWTSEEGLSAYPDITKTLRQNKDTAYINDLKRRVAAANASRPKPQDLGLTGSTPWYSENYVPKGWREINVPGYWEDQGIKDLDGIVWYRREIDVPASMVNVPAKLALGRIVDADVVYINGKQVGNTTYRYPQRRYPLEAGVLKAGKNVITVKVSNDNGKGGFMPDKPYYISAGKDTLDIKGTWLYKVGDVFTPQPAAPVFTAHYSPAALYNAMLAPTVPYTIKGFLWYQGEANGGAPEAYTSLMPGLIRDWRSKWGLGDLPFFYVQLPNYMEMKYLPGESSWAATREAQFKALSQPNTGMAVTIDLGEWNDVHPDRKKDVGDRLALLAQRTAYGDKQLVASGPLFQSAEIVNDSIIIHFTETGSGLITIDDEAPGDVAIAGDDKKFVWAKARITNNKLIVWHEDLKAPKFVRYAWADNPVHPNLYNKEGLPASPFRTDK